MKPDEIENLSFQIIEREIGAHNLRNEQWIIVRRMIHTSADFGYKDMVRFHSDAIKSGLSLSIALNNSLRCACNSSKPSL